MDLFVANDTVQNFLFVNRGGNRWEELGISAEVGFSETGQARSGMGVDSADFDNDGNVGTDADIEAFFACLAGHCCGSCESADFNGDGDTATDADIEAFFRVLAGGTC